MNGATCFICGKTYYYDNETHINVTRIERDGTNVKTIQWSGVVCDECIHKHFTKEVMR